MLIGHMNSPFRPLAEEFAFAAGHGFDFLELTVEPPSTPLEAVSAAEVERLSRLHNLPVPVGHGIWYMPYAHPVREIRAACRAYWDKYLSLCLELGIAAANIHVDFSCPQRLREQVFDHHFEFLSTLARKGRGVGVKIMLEPSGEGGEAAEMVERLLEGIPELYLHLDLGHAHMAYNDGGISFIRRHWRRLVHVHVSDNNGREDQHLPIGCGTVNFPRILNQLKRTGYDGTFTLEIFVSDRQYLLLGQEKLRRLWEEAV